MLFEARTINSYADPVSLETLKEGVTFFMVNFADEKMFVPQLSAVVFVGKDFEIGEDNIYYFQDIDSYSLGERYDSPKVGEDGAYFFKCAGNEFGGIYDFEVALEILMYCSLRRRGLAI